MTPKHQRDPAIPDAEIYCENCALFTLDVPDDEPGKPIFFKEGTHGLCQGAPGIPRHIEHRESLRCVWFVAKEKPLFADKAVEADSVEDFLNRYYKPQRFRERGEEYAQILIASHQRDFDRDGYDIISHHDSVTGRVVAWFGPGTGKKGGNQ